CAEHYKPVRCHRRDQAAECPLARRPVEIKQHVATQNEIETTRFGRLVEQVVRLKANFPPQRLASPPTGPRLFEEGHHLRDAEPALDLELRKIAFPSGGDDRPGDIG